MQIKDIPIELIEPNPWNARRLSRDDPRFRSIVNAIQMDGELSSIPIVRPLPNGRYQMVGGWHRTLAAKEAGLKSIPCIVREMSEQRARELTLLLNKAEGDDDWEALREALRALEEDFNLTREEISDLTAFDLNEIDDLLTFSLDDLASLAQLAKEAPEPDDEEMQWVRRSFRLPASAARVVDEAIQRVEQQEGVQAWRALELICADFLAGAEQDVSVA